MNNRKSTFAALVTAAILGVGSTGIVLAESNNNSQAEIQAISNAKITLDQATANAVKEVGGKVAGSGIENLDDTVFFYDIQILSADGSVKKVLVDMNTGKVVKVALDNEGDNEGNSENRENGEQESDEG